MKKKIGEFEVSYDVERYLNEVLNDREYRFINYYPVIVDVGANIGMFSLFMYDNADKIYAIEPAEENMKNLKQTIEDNNLTKIIPVQLAISDHNFVSPMERSGEAAMGGWRLSEAGDYPVDVRTLDEFMKSFKIEYIDLLKLDVEGEEINILNAKYFPHTKIGTIIGEYHGSACEQSVSQALKWMGYRYMNLGDGHFIARK